ncbi:MAG: hypothetical protein BWY57_02749 [Betaproteobacteria bacterium ADurb.Bin341]|nr:MAG: hypothetical protein BWY57_02749 [Betaproteobacteria bacterium ADurb.Bin341]
MTNTYLSRKQRGAVLLMLVAGVLLAAVTALVINQTKAIQNTARRTAVTKQRLEEIRNSLVQFVVVNGRLPCPANGAASQGTANPVTPIENCTTPNGTVPWSTLGLSATQALDGWGRRISYRVAQGPTGMTFTGAADMTQCQHPPLGTEIPPVGPNFLCTATHTESEAGFLAARTGLTVNDMGTNSPQVGFVLISHGSSGYGAWLESNQRMPLPAAGNTFEAANAGAGNTYYRAQHSDNSVPPTANNHFDDEVLFLTINDLIHKARRGGRNWNAGPAPIVGEPPTVNLDVTTLATGGAVFTGFRSGLQTVTLPVGPGVSVSMIISTAPGYQITTNNASGSTAIGVCSMSPPCNASNSQLENGEYLSFKLVSYTAQKVSLDFLNYGGGESATIEFKRNNVPVGLSVVTTFPSATIGLMPTTAPQAFDEVVVKPNPSSAFYISGIRFCDAASSCL